MRKTFAPILVVALLLLLCATAFAGQDYNELINPCFVDGSAGYDVEGSVLFNGNGTEEGGTPQWGRGHIAYTLYEQLSPAATSKVSQTVDDSLAPGWNENGTAKWFKWTGWYYTEQGSVTLHIGYWDSLTMDKPTPAMTPDHVIDYVLDPAAEWTQFTWEGILDTQPRWIRITAEFTCGGAGIDDMLFTSACIPEPSSLAAILGGLVSFGALAIRMRRP